MKKLYTCVLMCCVTMNSVCMTPIELTDDLCEVMHHIGHKEAKDCHYAYVKRLLQSGAHPNGEGCPLLDVVSMENGGRFVDLLIEYGADPSKAMLQATKPEAVLLLMQLGANINAVDQNGETLLMRLCNEEKDDWRMLVWVLNHGADPNSGPSKISGDYAIHMVLVWDHQKMDNLNKLIALLQNGVHLDVRDDQGETPLDVARRFLAEEAGHSCRFARAQLELLKALSEHKLDPHQVYTVAEYEFMGISRKSAQLIQAATEKVNAADLQCAQDDFEFEYGKQNVVTFIFDREIGMISKTR